jgi:hypothetical protein
MLLIFTALCRSEKMPTEVQRIVTEVLKGGYMLRGFNEREGKRKVQMGFTISARLSDIRAGEPMKVYVLDCGRTKALTIDEHVADCIAPWDFWRVPLMQNGKVVCFFDIIPDGKGGWTPGVFGYVPLAREWQKVIDAWPKEAGYHLIMIDTRTCGYMDVLFHVPEKDKNNLTRLECNGLDSTGLLAKASSNTYIELGTIREIGSRMNNVDAENGGLIRHKLR